MSPRDANELAAFLAAQSARGAKVEKIDLAQLNRILELTPEDMTVTVEAGISLNALQPALAKERQWLPIDPPDPAISIREILARDLSGPRRFGCGTIREHLIGMKVVLADGRVIKSGGKVVKNVAGYDLAKLFIGAGDSLGVIVEATFKLRPLPETERFVGSDVPLDRMTKTLRSVLDSPITPVVLDAHNGAKHESIAVRGRSDDRAVSLVLGFAGTQEEVDWQLERARALGFERETTLEGDRQFWSDNAPVHRTSVLPSRLVETFADLGPRPFVARAGNGVVYYRGEAVRITKPDLPRRLMQRVKTAFDPKNILPELTA